MNALTDFSQPQRQSLLGVLVMFANTLQKIVRAMWPILLVWLVKLDASNTLFIYLGIVAFVLIIAIISYLQYYFFTFYIDEENSDFVIQKGVLNKTKITIQLHKIQQVNINQSLIQRLINVYKLEIDTAGSDKKEASISAIPHELAIILKDRLINYASEKPTFTEEKEVVEAPSSLLKISLSSLIKIGFTSNYVKSFLLFFAFFTAMLENIKKIFESVEIQEDKMTGYLDKLPILTSIAIVLGTIIGIGLVVNLVQTIIKYYDFTIRKDKQSIVLSYGLLATKNTLLHPKKVQLVSTTQNFFQKKFDILTIGIRQASSNPGSNIKSDKIDVPGASKLERDEILKILFNTFPEKGKLMLPNWRKLALESFFLLLLPIVVFILVNVSFDLFIWNELVMYCSIFALFSGILLWFSYKNYRLFVSTDFIIKQNGAWDVDNTIVEPYKIQAITTKQFFWQKATNIGSVTLATAGGNIDFSTGNYLEIKKMVNNWVYQVETTNKNWM
ncbi:PH domain-containing protein [Flavobacterium sp.]|jgi:putative membrane protein|uniref:PH domain-containing protein n=1 Tax=Flavobacterium sp. TaxID=239 RepID=UPI0037BF453D